MMDTVFTGNETAYKICLITLAVLNLVDGKMLTVRGNARKIGYDINERENSFDDSSKILDRSIGGTDEANNIQHSVGAQINHHIDPESYTIGTYAIG